MWTSHDAVGDGASWSGTDGSPCSYCMDLASSGGPRGDAGARPFAGRPGAEGLLGSDPASGGRAVVIAWLTSTVTVGSAVVLALLR
ncbi:hypothetical protein ACF068_28395 [Streptomyces sp. NPDC016309]|uniref:hypothetical protein n=1 Tax=Streptomyces sp. NPDC016309 TaxID=3364965 RepID=UPI0036F5E670